MSEKSVVTFSITQEDLILSFRAYHLLRQDRSSREKRARRKLENEFLVAIAEASGAGQLAYDMLIGLDELVDVESGRRICPQVHNRCLQKAIASAKVQEEKLQATAQGMIAEPVGA